MNLQISHRIFWGKMVLFFLFVWGGEFVLQVSAQVTKTSVEAKANTGNDWSSFLGPQGTGVSQEMGTLQQWQAKGPLVIWKKKIGTGYSAPSVLGKFLVVHHRPNKGDEYVDCIQSETGKPIWSYHYKSTYVDPYGYNDGPRCTPLLTKEFCYTFGAEGKLLCLNMANGTKIWECNTQQVFKIPRHFFGVGCTPILEGNKLIVLVGGQPNAGVVAFNAQTGKIIWQAVGKDVWNGAAMDEFGKQKYQWTGKEMLVSYSSPLIATIHGKKHLLCLTRQGLVSLNPETGALRFKYWFQSRTHDSVNAARPVIINDRIFISAAYKVGSALLQVSQDSKSYKVLWRNRKNMLAHWSTPIHVAGYIYGFSGRHEQGAEFRCIDLKTGHIKWATSGFDGEINDLEPEPKTGRIRDKNTKKIIPFPFFGRASKIQVGKRFIILGERGTLALANINNNKYEEISRTSYSQIHYPLWTAPVLAHHKLYLRSEDYLLCLDVSKK